MKRDYTHIVLLIDRSGSMSSIKRDMDGGIKAFIENQKLAPGYCTITAAQFDTEFEFICNRLPINEVDKIEISPRGGTALIDSMCRLINEVGKDMCTLSEDERPEKILFVTITDGEENSSRENTNEDLTKMIQTQEKAYSWNFTYIGANQDAFGVASKFGGQVGNSLNYTATSAGVTTMFNTLSNATLRYRSMDVSDVISSNGTSFSYTEDEQKTV